MSARGSAARFPKGYEPDPVAKYGTLDVVFDYDSEDQQLAVTIMAVSDLPALKRTGNISWQVHLVLLPTKKQRAKTGIQRGPCPIFTETFRFSHVESEMISNYAIRFRLYSMRRMKKEKVLGEKVFYLTKLNLQGKMSVPVILDPCCALPVSRIKAGVGFQELSQHLTNCSSMLIDLSRDWITFSEQGYILQLERILTSCFMKQLLLFAMVVSCIYGGVRLPPLHSRE